MLLFFIHGVNTASCRYADTLIGKIKHTHRSKDPLHCYSSFWGHSFNDQKHTFINDIFFRHRDKDLGSVKISQNEVKYRYKKQRQKLITHFLGDFLTYQNPRRSQKIRRALFEQFHEFLASHPQEREVHFISHSLGTFILWELLFSDTLPNLDPAFDFRSLLKDRQLASITTMGSPLLLFKHMLELDFSAIAHWSSHNITNKHHTPQKLQWLNIVHASDMLAYPLQSVFNELQSPIQFSDRFITRHANGIEKQLRSIGQHDFAMIGAASDAHSSYLSPGRKGDLTAKLISKVCLSKNTHPHIIS